MKQRLFSAIALVLLAIVGAGCGSSDSSVTPSTNKSDSAMIGHDGANIPVGMDHTAVNEGMRIHIEDGQRLRFPGLNTFRFRVMGKDGKELTPDQLKIVHEKLMHFLIVRDDMTQFQHLHPVYESGVWMVTTTMAQPGDYNFYLDIAPKAEDATVLRMSLRIATPTIKKEFPTPNTKQRVMDQDVVATLATAGAWTSGQEKTVVFALTKASKPVSEIDPYLGAFGHLVILRHNAPDEFLHVHPLTEGAPKDGKVSFMTTFTDPGRYTLYAQFSIGGSIRTFPITIDVTGEAAKMMPTNGRRNH